MTGQGMAPAAQVFTLQFIQSGHQPRLSGHPEAVLFNHLLPCAMDSDDKGVSPFCPSINPDVILPWGDFTSQIDQSRHYLQSPTRVSRIFKQRGFRHLVGESIKHMLADFADSRISPPRADRFGVEKHTVLGEIPTAIVGPLR